MQKQSQREIWDKIAEGWTNWRQKQTSTNVNRFAEGWRPGSILDIGCGNGRYLLPFYRLGFKCHGVDFSKEMIKQAKIFSEKNIMKINLKVSRAEELPYEAESFDYCLMIAVLHHLETKEARLRAVKEMKRVMKSDGIGFVHVWNKLQPKFLFKSSDTYIPWKKKEGVLFRFYHLFNWWELKSLLESAGFEVFWSSGAFGKSIEFLVKKRTRN